MAGEWEYLHEYWGQYPRALDASKSGAPPNAKASLVNHLDRRGSERWELVQMEAHWQWESVSKGLSQLSYPAQIVGYALTFKRPKG